MTPSTIEGEVTVNNTSALTATLVHDRRRDHSETIATLATVRTPDNSAILVHDRRGSCHSNRDANLGVNRPMAANPHRDEKKGSKNGTCACVLTKV